MLQTFIQKKRSKQNGVFYISILIIAPEYFDYPRAIIIDQLKLEWTSFSEIFMKHALLNERKRQKGIQGFH